VGRSLFAALGATLLVLASLSYAQAAGESENFIEKVSVALQTWRHDGKFLILEIAIKNENSFSVSVVILCEVHGDRAKPQDNRRVSIRHPLPHGSATVQGLEFPIADDKAQGGPCKVDSVTRSSQ
jgi:hypothetical protein